MDYSSSRPLAVITGASSGIGYELAKQFAQHGFDLLVTATGSKIDQVAPDFEQFGVQVTTVQADLASYEGVEALFDQMQAMSRPIDAIAINAGVGVGGRFAETELQEELNLIKLNIESSVHLAKRVLPGMLERRSGKILFTSSIAALQPGPFEAVYAASKSFVHSFAEALRSELKDTGVTVTALMPGPTATNFFHRAGMDDTRVGVLKKDDPEDVAKQGFEALMAEEDALLAGSLTTKVLGRVSKVLPDAMNAAVHHQLAEPGSGHK